MARGVTTVQSRTQPTEDTISFPVLTYSDALPRNDLRSLEASQYPVQPAMIGQWDFSQPSTGDGWFRKPPPAEGATFDFRITAPPDEAIQTTRSGRTQTEEHMIGIALGSPGLLTKDEPLPPPRFDTSIFAARDSAHRPSKWKKIGGFFKAKNALTSLSDNAQESEVKPQSNNYKLPEKPQKARLRKNSTEEWPKVEIDSRNMAGRSIQAPQRSRALSLGNKPPKVEPSTQRLLLSVDIPDVQMERYSVMFSDVVNKNQKPSLLARRARTLDNLRVPDANGFLKSPAPPPIPQRRATSPAQSSFTLFPTSQPSKAAQGLGTYNFSRAPNPLVRANTLPAESPSKMPGPQIHHSSNMGSLSSFESPVIPKLFSERSSTSRSSNSYDKPLPAIRPEPQATSSPLQKSAQPEKKAPSPQKTRQQHIAQSHNIVATKPVAQPRIHPQPRKDSLPRPTIKQSQATSPQHKTTQNKPNKTSSHRRTNDSARPCLRVETEGRPQALTKLSPSTSGSSPSALNPTQSKIDRIMSPSSASTGPKSAVSPADSTRMPFADAVETIETIETAEEESEPEPRHPTPRIEVSTARSVSVSRAKRQVLVPIGMRIDHLDPEERVVHRRPMTPQIIDAQRGHRPGVSQELRIECL
ncbi:hypothetical protein N7516_003956 [Penicillium verrucosum]|uniref:uncharacterized protein n=1 Tax=Penicillium verrucosum TaxID=60171 RepID=UPI0025459CE5|nr:uncharacterized protein N7516_003956 [Penicillium verrucosum]KAJ5943788.1 hypothetical protein N7516_003956 [Penicillium verrucosum]